MPSRVPCQPSFAHVARLLYAVNAVKQSRGQDCYASPCPLSPGSHQVLGIAVQAIQYWRNSAMPLRRNPVNHAPVSGAPTQNGGFTPVENPSQKISNGETASVLQTQACVVEQPRKVEAVRFGPGGRIHIVGDAPLVYACCIASFSIFSVN